jgi:hypothetical protein
MERGKGAARPRGPGGPPAGPPPELAAREEREAIGGVGRDEVGVVAQVGQQVHRADGAAVRRDGQGRARPGLHVAGEQDLG